MATETLILADASILDPSEESDGSVKLGSSRTFLLSILLLLQIHTHLLVPLLPVAAITESTFFDLVTARALTVSATQNAA